MTSTLLSKSFRLKLPLLKRWRNLFRLLPLSLLLLAVSACAAGETPPAAICDTYSRALFTTQLMGGAALLLGLALLGFRKNLSDILP